MRQQEAMLNIITVLEPIGPLTLQVEVQVVVEAHLLGTAQLGALLHMEDHQVLAALTEDLLDQVEVLRHLAGHLLAQEVVVPLEDHPLQVAGLQEAAREVVVPQEVAAHHVVAEVADKIKST